MSVQSFEPSASAYLRRWTFSVDEFHRMLEAGILKEDDRVELIEGEIVRLSPIGRRHAACVDRIYQLLCRLLGQNASIRGQNPLLLGDSSEPEPDISILKRRDDFYADSLPTAADVLLLIEVADSSIDFDREVKLPLYAKGGIPVVWIVDLNQDQVESYSEPVNGVYGKSRVYRRGDSLSPVGSSQLSIRVEDLV